MGLHRGEQGADRTALLDARHPVGEHDKPQPFDAEWGEGVFALVHRHQVPQSANRDQALEVIVLERAVVPEGVLAEEFHLLIEDEDPFVVDPRDLLGTLDREVRRDLTETIPWDRVVAGRLSGHAFASGVRGRS